MAKKVNLEDIWPELEAGVGQLITNLNDGFPRARWMQLYSYEFPRFVAFFFINSIKACV
jgi:hypothetical protein